MAPWADAGDSLDVSAAVSGFSAGGLTGGALAALASIGGSERGDCDAVCIGRAAGASKTTSNAIVAPAPSRSSAMCPALRFPSARPLRLASLANFSAPSAIKSRAAPMRSRADGVASINSPSALNIAASQAASAISRRARSGNERSGPARSLANTRTALLLSGSVKREHRQITVPPKRAPKPRNRSSRGVPARGNVLDKRLICPAAGCLASNSMAASAPGESASKIAAAVGLAQRTREASALHSHAGFGLRACSASRGSLR
jgi:hypothetical protein